MIVSEGWDAAREKYKGKKKKIAGPTVGEFIRAVSSIRDVKEISHENSVTKFRTIVSQIKNITFKKKKEPALWRERIEAVKLAEINPDLIKEWRDNRFHKYTDPIAK